MEDLENLKKLIEKYFLQIKFLFLANTLLVCFA